MTEDSDKKNTIDAEGDADPRARWTTGADGIERLSDEIEIEDLTTPEQRARNAEAAHIKDDSLRLARIRAASLGDDDDEDDDDDEAEGAEGKN